MRTTGTTRTIRVPRGRTSTRTRTYAHPRTRTAFMTGMTGAAVAGALLLTGCGTSSDASNSANVAAVTADAPQKPGTVLDTPFTKPHLVLTDKQGKPFDLVKETAGHPTLLFFGYTHCPDVCPTTMSDLALAKSKLPKADQSALRVVYVSTDPDRDTPARLTEWLGAMDKSFIGLTGKFATIQAAARSVGVGIDPPVKEKDGSITVTHGAEVLAFFPKDNKAHVLYMSGTTAEQYAADLPKIVRNEAP
jgi:protein SCO1/2